MKKILTVLIAITISYCKASNMAKLDEVSDLVFDKGYGETEVLEMVNGVYYKELYKLWGEPDEMFVCGWGDVWNIGNDKQINVFYNDVGFVENVIICNI